MRRLIAFAIAAATLLPGAPATAAETGAIEGRAVNGITGEPQAGVRVALQGGNEDGSAVVKKTVTTEADGRFAFTDLASGEDRIYLVDASFDGGLFAGRALRLPDDTEKPPVVETTIKVWETTTDPAVIAITRDDIFLIPAEEGIAVIESVSIFNSSDEAYIGRGADDPGATDQTPTIGYAAPARAEQVRILDSNLDIPELVPAEFGFGATIAIPPGTNQTTFTYRLLETAAQYDISRTVLYPTAQLSVFARPPLALQSNRLVEAGEEDIGGTRYRVWSGEEDIDSGDPLQMLAIAEAGVPVALLAGVAAFVVLVGAGLGLALRRRSKRAATSSPAGRRPEREDVLTAIARLDLDYQSGAVGRDTWERERDRLKRRLVESEPGA